MMKRRLVLSLLLLAAQSIAPARAHCFKVWHYHTPQRCSYAHLTQSLRYQMRYPRMLAQIDRPEPIETSSIKQDVSATTRRIAPVAPETEREIGLEALREKMQELPR